MKCNKIFHFGNYFIIYISKDYFIKIDYIFWLRLLLGENIHKIFENQFKLCVFDIPRQEECLFKISYFENQIFSLGCYLKYKGFKSIDICNLKVREYSKL